MLNVGYFWCHISQTFERLTAITEIVFLTLMLEISEYMGGKFHFVGIKWNRSKQSHEKRD